MTRRKIRYDPTDDFYAVLGVPPSASTEEIHRAFRKRAKQVHPDLNPDNLNWAHAQFQRVNDAHDILSDPVLRLEYDTSRRMPRSEAQNQPQGTTRPRSTTQLSEASRAAWAYRHNRRRAFPGIFLLAFLLFIVSCWALQFPQQEQSNVTATAAAAASDATQVVIVAANLSTPAADSVLSACRPDEEIVEPVNGARIDGPFAVRGTASGSEFKSYSLSLGIRSARQGQMTWLPVVVSFKQRVENGLLVPKGIGNLSLLALLAQIRTDVTLRLVVQVANGSSLPPCDVLLHFGVRQPSLDSPSTNE